MLGTKDVDGNVHPKRSRVPLISSSGRGDWRDRLGTTLDDHFSRADRNGSGLEPTSQEDLGNVRDGIAGTMKDSLRMDYNEGAFSPDGEPPEQEVEELEFTEEASGKLDEITEDFVGSSQLRV